MSARVLIGIHAYEQPLPLRATITALRRRSPEAELLVLADGPDPATLAEVDRLGIACWLSPSPQGAAASFNQLLARGGADVYVFLESGALVGPGWLERLLAALAKENVGLGGPSTNHAWNEQGCLRTSREADVEAAAAVAARRFGDQTRTLEPLLSLGDFCYAVGRDVVERIGGADESYGLGPCWEMDYNARAARAGFQGVWVCGAYVWRPEFTGRRQTDEPRLHDHSRRLYQDRLCAVRLRGGAGDAYEPHCRGLECEHFAPPELVQVHRTVPEAQPLRARPSPAPSLTRRRSQLRVSCVMPTGGRLEFALAAVRYFQRQDYEDRELVIVDDGGDGLAELLPEDPRIVYVPSPRGESIGAKRNRGCRVASGALIAHWDDDDWFSPTRLSDQVGPILSGHAEITGLICKTVLELPAWRFWTWTPELHRRLFVGDVHGGTLVYRRELWSRCGGYPDSSLAEDAFLLHNAVRRGARLLRLDGEGRYVYVRHERNSWSFDAGRHVDPRGWIPAAEPALPAEDRAFYRERSSAGAEAEGVPMVSCLMPTYNRAEFVSRAVEYFLRQDYTHSELIVIDDGPEPVAGLPPASHRIRYLRLDGRHSIGAKRNLGADHARGDLLANWDDDDWYASWRLSDQVARLRATGADICGLATLLYLNPATGQAWRYAPPLGMKSWVADGTLMFTRDFWQRNHFPDTSMGIDCRLLWNTIPKRLEILDREEMFVGIMHHGNTSPKDTGHSVWRELDPAVVRDAMGEDYERYAGGPQAPAAIAAAPVGVVSAS